jgi:hypothetical protein
MTVFVFVGPTLSAEEVRREIGATCLPPVAQGDVYRLVSNHPRAIGIIDGYFASTPAVWHKEILWALAQGVHVFGSGSMGALRAAELAVYGMIGVGAIYRQFVDGSLQDDDEVAIIHAPAELQYRNVSDAMVNIRATLAAAERGAVIGPELHQTLLRIAKDLHYPDRNYDSILKLASVQGESDEELQRLEDWLPEGRVDQKREDALAMLGVMREHLARHPGPHRPNFEFEPTRAWSQGMLGASEDGPMAGRPSGTSLRDFLQRFLE